MMKKKDPQHLKLKDKDSFFDSEVDTVVSSTECTGLIQTPPVTESEAESYADLYTAPKPEGPGPREATHDPHE